jgi:hypothetical protein
MIVPQFRVSGLVGNLGGTSAAQDSVGLKTKKDTSKNYEKRIVVAVLHFLNIVVMLRPLNAAAPRVCFRTIEFYRPRFFSAAFAS